MVQHGSVEKTIRGMARGERDRDRLFGGGSREEGSARGAEVAPRDVHGQLRGRLAR